MVVFGQKWLCSGKSCCNRLKVVVLGESNCILAKFVLFDKRKVVFGQRGCPRVKVDVFGKKLL